MVSGEPMGLGERWARYGAGWDGAARTECGECGGRVRQGDEGGQGPRFLVMKVAMGAAGRSAESGQGDVCAFNKCLFVVACFVFSVVVALSA